MIYSYEIEKQVLAALLQKPSDPGAVWERGEEGRKCALVWARGDTLDSGNPRFAFWKILNTR